MGPSPPGFWDFVWSAEWAAGFVQNLLAGLATTALGLLGAYLFLYRQFRHDRKLVRQQARSELLSRLADRAGTCLLDASLALRKLDQEELRTAVWKSARPPWYLPLREAIALLSSVPELRPPRNLLIAGDDAETAWTVVGNFARGRRRAKFTSLERLATTLTFRPFVDALMEASNAYRSWDGVGALRVDAFDNYEFLAPPPEVDADIDGWNSERSARVAKAAEAVFQELRYKHGTYTKVKDENGVTMWITPAYLEATAAVEGAKVGQAPDS